MEITTLESIKNIEKLALELYEYKGEIPVEQEIENITMILNYCKGILEILENEGINGSKNSYHWC
jgi:hypothetical protein